MVKLQLYARRQHVRPHIVSCVYIVRIARTCCFLSRTKPEQYKIRGCKVRRTFAIYINTECWVKQIA